MIGYTRGNWCEFISYMHVKFLWQCNFFTTGCPLLDLGARSDNVPTNPDISDLKMVIKFNIWYTYHVHITLIMAGNVARLNGTCGTYPYNNNLRARGKYSNTNLGLDVWAKQVKVIITAWDIMIYHPQVFCVRYGPNQIYSPEYDWGCISPSFKWRWGEEHWSLNN